MKNSFSYTCIRRAVLWNSLPYDMREGKPLSQFKWLAHLNFWFFKYYVHRIHEKQVLYLLQGYVSVKSKLQHAPPPPPPGISRAFDTFVVPGRREFGYQSLPGGGEFKLHPRFHVKSLAWRAIRGFSWKRLWVSGQLVARKGLKQALRRNWSI